MSSSNSSASVEDESSPGFLMRSTIKSMSLKFSSVKNVSTGQLWSWLKTPQERQVFILDTRPVEEYNISHIENAVRVSHEDSDMNSLVQTLEQSLAGKPNPTVVCYCSVGYRSSVVAQNLQKFYKDSGKTPVPEIYNLAGSLFQWANEERPMVDSNGRQTHFAHPYTSFWGKLLHAQHRANVSS
ncbi:histone-lysine N-methyltransferase SETMAR [Plakobranchus ocellatus]|uniref:Histone-lysine N-methyltransferase SETMAR n=1 Tax=Plakobranchus ocellatus TaxID=259542 RepID=A0AAV4DJV9_9GAST|nr:histone-lysine N-methyltransferase SETMAR [Plakobranchus ocellatus]